MTTMMPGQKRPNGAQMMICTDADLNRKRTEMNVTANSHVAAPGGTNGSVLALPPPQIPLSPPPKQDLKRAKTDMTGEKSTHVKVDNKTGDKLLEAKSADPPGEYRRAQ